MISANDFHFMGIFSEQQSSPHLQNDSLKEKNYLLSPWPWEGNNTFFRLNDGLTDFIVPSFDSSDSCTRLYEERIALLWDGNLLLSLSLTEKDLIQWENLKERKEWLEKTQERLMENHYKGILWELTLGKDSSVNENLTDLILDLRSELTKDLLYYYSLNYKEEALPELIEESDYIIMKAYDYSGRHSTMENVNETVENFLVRKKIPPEKLILSLPLYGRNYKSNTPQYWVDKLPYYSIVETYLPLANENEKENYYFNGTDMARRKAEYAREKGLAGVALFPLEWDGPGQYSLKEAITDYLSE